jgi:hypothetical protein
MPANRPTRIPVAVGARQARLSTQGLLKILKRTGRVTRDDGRNYCEPDFVARVIEAREVLGIDRKKRV